MRSITKTHEVANLMLKKKQGPKRGHSQKKIKIKTNMDLQKNTHKKQRGDKTLVLHFKL